MNVPCRFQSTLFFIPSLSSKPKSTTPPPFASSTSWFSSYTNPSPSILIVVSILVLKKTDKKICSLRRWPPFKFWWVYCWCVWIVDSGCWNNQTPRNSIFNHPMVGNRSQNLNCMCVFLSFKMLKFCFNTWLIFFLWCVLYVTCEIYMFLTKKKMSTSLRFKKKSQETPFFFSEILWDIWAEVLMITTYHSAINPFLCWLFWSYQWSRFSSANSPFLDDLSVPLRSE